MNKRVCALFLVVQGIILVQAGKNDIYSGYSVYGIKIQDVEHQTFLHALITDLDLDIWQHGYPGRRDAHIMSSPEKSKEFLKELDIAGIVYYVYAEDVARALDQQDQELSKWRMTRSAEGRLTPFEDYPRMAEIDAYIDYLAETYPNEVTVITAGPSFEGHPIRYLQISTTNFTDATKPIYFLNAGIHSREWVTVPVALYALNRLLEARIAGEEDLLNDIDWIVMPVVNPDGWEYTHTTERLWRRTRSFNATISTTCYGVDGNRNFDYNFDQYGTSNNPCSDVYPGPVPFSEVETQYVRDILLQYTGRIEVYLDIHSYGNYILFGYDDVLAPNTAQLHHMSALMGAVIDQHKLPEAYYYLVGNGGLILYAAAGNAQDYAQSVGVPFSMTLELPGMGNWWFEVPPSYIDHINFETWEGIAASARLARSYYRAKING